MTWLVRLRRSRIYDDTLRGRLASPEDFQGRPSTNDLLSNRVSLFRLNSHSHWAPENPPLSTTFPPLSTTPNKLVRQRILRLRIPWMLPKRTREDEIEQCSRSGQRKSGPRTTDPHPANILALSVTPDKLKTANCHCQPPTDNGQWTGRSGKGTAPSISKSPGVALTPSP